MMSDALRYTQSLNHADLSQQRMSLACTVFILISHGLSELLLLSSQFTVSIGLITLYTNHSREQAPIVSKLIQ